MQSDEEGLGGGEWEEAPNNRDGGSSPVASILTGVAAIRTLHTNVVGYIRDEMNRLDASTEDQALWLGAIAKAISLRALLKNQLQEVQHQAIKQDQERLDQEVWADLGAWAPSSKQEYEQLVNKKCAVRQVTKEELRNMSSEMKVSNKTRKSLKLWH